MALFHLVYGILIMHFIYLALEMELNELINNTQSRLMKRFEMTHLNDSVIVL